MFFFYQIFSTLDVIVINSLVSLPFKTGLKNDGDKKVFLEKKINTAHWGKLKKVMFPGFHHFFLGIKSLQFLHKKYIFEWHPKCKWRQTAIRTKKTKRNVKVYSEIFYPTVGIRNWEDSQLQTR